MYLKGCTPSRHLHSTITYQHKIISDSCVSLTYQTHKMASRQHNNVVLDTSFKRTASDLCQKTTVTEVMIGPRELSAEGQEHWHPFIKFNAQRTDRWRNEFGDELNNMWIRPLQTHKALCFSLSLWSLPMHSFLEFLRSLSLRAKTISSSCREARGWELGTDYGYCFQNREQSLLYSILKSVKQAEIVMV